MFTSANNIWIKALEYARTDDSDNCKLFLWHTVGVAFLGTPFRNCAEDFLTVTQLRRLIAIQNKREYSGELVGMLEKHHDSDLYNLVSRFCQMVARQDNSFPITCFYETYATDFSTKQQDLIKELNDPDLESKKSEVGKVPVCYKSHHRFLS